MKVEKWFTPEEIIGSLEAFNDKLSIEKFNPLKDFGVFLKAFVEIYNTLIQGDDEEDDDLMGFALAIQDDLDEKGEATYYFSVKGGEKLVMKAEKEEFGLGTWSGEFKSSPDDPSILIELSAESAKELLLGNTDLEIMVKEDMISIDGSASFLDVVELWFDDFFGLLLGGDIDDGDYDDYEEVDDD
jgi:hypothetical protein